MKGSLKNILLVGILLFSLKHTAQTLTALNFSPEIGEYFKYNAGSKNINPGNSGTNQFWDFSSVASNSWAAHNYIVANNRQSDFPDCDFAKSESSGYFLRYFEHSDSGLRWRGHVMNGGAAVNSWPRLEMCFPLSVGTICYDSQPGVFSYTMTADATGTLISPLGTYPNSLRVLSTRILNIGSSTQTTVKYSWYCGGTNDVIFTSAPDGSNPTYLSLLLTDISQNTLQNNFSGLYPNPISSELTVLLSNIDTNKLKIIFFNCLGQAFYCPIKYDEHSIKINTEDLIPGMYFLKIFDDKTFLRSEKIIKK